MVIMTVMVGIIPDTIGASKGKFYWEMTVDAMNQVICASIAGPSGIDSNNGARLGYLPGQTDDAGVTYYDDGRLYQLLTTKVAVVLGDPHMVLVML